MAFEIEARPRPETGKGNARRVRSSGFTPAVVYSGGKEAMSVSVEPKGLRKALSGPLGRNTLLALALPGGSRTVLVKDLQVHPVRHDLTHADFLEVTESTVVKVKIPVTMVGRNKNLSAGAVVEQVGRTILVEVKPIDIPQNLEVDISELGVGQSIHVKDLNLPTGVKAVTRGEQTIATVVALREEKATAQAAVPDAAAAAATPGKPGAPAAAAAPAKK